MTATPPFRVLLLFVFAVAISPAASAGVDEPDFGQREACPPLASPRLELADVSGAVPLEGEYRQMLESLELADVSGAVPLKAPAAPAGKITPLDQGYPAGMGTLSPFHPQLPAIRESRVESSAVNRSYWRILGPVTLTLGVGAATWVLYTTRSR